MKSAIITGGNRGIGRYITQSFVNAGYFVVVGARQELGLSKEFGDKVEFVSCDVQKESDHFELVNRALAKADTLDVYVNNAGFSAWRPISEIDDSFLTELFDTNLKGAFWGCKAATEGMTSGGSIINISSIAGKRGSANNSAYCASKFGMNGLTQALAKELGPRNIRVNALCPVLIKTDGLLEALDGKFSPAGGDSEKFFDDFISNNSALGRLPKGEEVAEMCLVLASDKSSAITGQCINLDCGVFPQ